MPQEFEIGEVFHNTKQVKPIISKPLKIQKINPKNIAFGKQIPKTPVKHSREIISGEFFVGDLKKSILPKIPNIYEQDKNLNRGAWMSPAFDRSKDF